MWGIFSNNAEILVSGYHKLIPTLNLPDQNDRHVLAAAIRTSASVIVTYNLKDFLNQTLTDYDIEAQHPDEFIMSLIDLSLGKVCTAVKRCRQRLKKPPFTIERYLKNLERQSLIRTVNVLQEFQSIL